MCGGDSTDSLKKGGIYLKTTPGNRLYTNSTIHPVSQMRDSLIAGSFFLCCFFNVKSCKLHLETTLMTAVRGNLNREVKTVKPKQYVKRC